MKPTYFGAYRLRFVSINNYWMDCQKIGCTLEISNINEQMVAKMVNIVNLLNVSMLLASHVSSYFSI